MNYIDEGGTLPVPFNMIPTPKSGRYAWRWIKKHCNGNGDSRTGNELVKKQTFIKVPLQKVQIYIAHLRHLAIELVSLT